MGCTSETEMKYLYLHGFASSPRSTKAQQLLNRIPSLVIPDLNQNDFQNLTLTRQIQQVKSLINEPAILIGSSFGGLTAAWVAQDCEWVDRMILLAPAFDWLPPFEQPGQPTLVYHYGEKRSLNYKIVEDLAQYNEDNLRKNIPTLILHGIWDETIPIERSRQFAATRSWVNLIELESDHGLTDRENEVWQAILEFCAGQI
jgi:uncharacterized protein